MPLSKDVGENVKQLKKEHPEWSDDKVLAAAISAARERGAKVDKANN